jgi:hypothetical protein
MPQGTRVAKCVADVKAKGGKVNPYAVCQASTHQSYATGKPLKDKGPKPSHLKHMKDHGL